MTGSVPTEKLPEKSHDIPKCERRTIERRQTFNMLGSQRSTSTALTQQIYNIKDLNKQVQQKSIDPWLANKLNEDKVRFELFDERRYIAKYTIIVNSALEFNIFAYNWPVPDDNQIFKETRRSVKCLDIVELLKSVENWCLCNDLGQDDNVLSAAVDPTGNPDPESKSIIRHSIP